MTKDEFEEQFDPDNGIIYLEPWDIFSKGIVGISEDKCHVIYGYYKLLDAIATDFEENYHGDEEPDFIQDAAEWLDYNTIRSTPYSDPTHAPIIIYEVQ